MSSERRREIRYPIEVPITLAAAGVVQSTSTMDVSYSGLFARTNEPPQVRQLTRIQIELPDTGQLFETHAMTVFVREVDDIDDALEVDGEPGCGLKFYAMSESNRRMWNGFVDSLRAQANTPTATPVPAAPRQRPRQVRFKTRVALRLETVVALEELYQRELSTGLVRVKVRKPPSVGAPLRLDVVHPTSGAIFKLDGTVTQLVDELTGVEIALDDFGDDRRAAFVDFIGQ